jgi:lysophospholipase L1-like esterase
MRLPYTEHDNHAVGQSQFIFIVRMQMFDDACKLAPPEYWGPDGVHPSHAGHMLMAKTWIAAVTGSA